jgi:hypothetical protein
MKAPIGITTAKLTHEALLRQGYRRVFVSTQHDCYLARCTQGRPVIAKLTKGGILTVFR